MKKCGKVLMVVMIVIVSITSVAILQGCNGQYAKVSNLVCIKVNSFMAKFGSPEFNFTKEGDGTMYVTVPYTNTLKITDLIVSPESTATVYNDAEHTSKIEDTKKIDLEVVDTFPCKKSLFIVVQNDKMKKQSTEYRIVVKVEKPKGVSESQLKDVPLENPDGHIWIPENATTITVESVEYAVVRTVEDILPHVSIENPGIHEIKVINTSIIFANDILNENSDLPILKLVEGATLDGNNYNLGVSSGSFGHLINWNFGKIKNVILPEVNGNVKYKRLCNNNYGSIENCVNYNPSTPSEQLETVFGKGVFRLGTSSISECINYAALASSTEETIYGIGMANKVNYCYNLGNIIASSSIGITGGQSKVTNCANLGSLDTEYSSVGIAFSPIDAYNNANYGNLTSKGEVQGLYSFIMISKDIKTYVNKNYGKLKGRKCYDVYNEIKK